MASTMCQMALVVMDPPANAADTRDSGSIPELGRALEVGKGNPLQCSCLDNSMERGAWQATVRGATKSQTRLEWLNTHTHTHTHTHHVPSPWYLLYLFNNTEVWSLPPRKDIKWIRGLTLWDGAVIKAGEVLSASGSGSLEEWKYIQGMPSNLLWLLLRTKGWSQWNWDWEAGWGLEVKGMSMPLPRIAN